MPARVEELARRVNGKEVRRQEVRSQRELPPCARLAAHPENLSRAYCRQRFHDLEHERPQIGEPVALGYENQYGNVEPANVLLVGKIPVNGQKNIELPRGQLEEFPVFLAGPAHFRYCARLVPREVAFQLARQALIK